MSTEGEENKSFKVSDKRRFDEQGQEREVSSQGETVSSEARPAAAVESGAHQPAEINFSSFAMSLATQALMQLGQIKPPDGVDLAVDRLAAKQTIDLLSMLEVKTRGNLEPVEKQMLEEILHNLHIIYVKRGQ